MNIQELEKLLWRHKANPGMKSLEQEFQIAKDKLKQRIQEHPRLRGFLDLEITDDLVIDFVCQFFNSGGWDHFEVLNWLKKVGKIEHEWDYQATKVVAQMIHEPKKLRECMTWLGLEWL